MIVSKLAEAGLEAEPFPHVLIDGMFDADTYRALANSFPVCPSASGPTGFTIHRGDAQFDGVMNGDHCWRTLYEACRAPDFLDAMTALFADEISRSAYTPAAALRHADHLESRADKERERLSPSPDVAPEDVFLRFDFMQGRDSYGREPHLDHRRRLATMLLYFDAPSPETFVGGDLVLHRADGSEARRIAPSENRAVLFPCSERSWHSVTPVRECRLPRRFVQVSLTSRHALWPDAVLPGGSHAAAHRRTLASVKRRFVTMLSGRSLARSAAPPD